MKILAINPGSTSTKIAVYHDKELTLKKSINHRIDDLKQFKTPAEQFEFRKEHILETLKEANIKSDDFDGIIGRGGLIRPIPSGVYEVNEAMKHDLIHAKRSHACNLGGLIADELSRHSKKGCKAYIADPGIVDELEDIARISGSPMLPRISLFHALNQKAIGRRYAKENNLYYEKLNLVICHLGGGISVGVHKNGRVVDVNNALDGEGPFSPERAGTLPAGELIDLCFSGEYTQEELKKRISGHAGLAAHLGTTQLPIIEENIANGDKKAELVTNAMIYNIAKEIGSACTVLKGNIDAILLTGGMAKSDYILSRLTDRINFLGKIKIYPGEDELEALALNAYYALKGTREVGIY